MQQLPVIPAPLGATPGIPGSQSTATSAGTTLFGIEFSTAFFRAIQTAIPTANGASLTADLAAFPSGLPGLPALLASLADANQGTGALSAALPTEPLSAEAEIFPFLGNLVPKPTGDETPVPVADFVFPELPAVETSVAQGPEVALSTDTTATTITLQAPFDRLLQSLKQATMPSEDPSAIQEANLPGAPAETITTLTAAVLPALPMQPPVAEELPLHGEKILTADAGSTALPVNTAPVAMAQEIKTPLLESGRSETLGRQGSVLPLSFLPKETRLEVPRAVLGRFSNTRGREVELPPPNLSMLTPTELAAEGVSSEDRNATVLARLDRVEFVNRMTQALERARLESPKSIELELNPPSLGKLRIEVLDIDGQLTARIQTESSAARSLLLEHLPVLDRHLGEHGIEMQRLQVDHTKGPTSAFSGDADPNSRQNPQSQDQPRQSHPPWQWRARDEEGERGPPLSLSELLALAPGMDRLI